MHLWSLLTILTFETIFFKCKIFELFLYSIQTLKVYNFNKDSNSSKDSHKPDFSLDISLFWILLWSIHGGSVIVWKCGDEGFRPNRLFSSLIYSTKKPRRGSKWIGRFGPGKKDLSSRKFSATQLNEKISIEETKESSFASERRSFTKSAFGIILKPFLQS